MIDRDQWLNALNDAGISLEDDPQAVTVMEFATMIGMKRAAAKARLDALVAAGKATQTRKHSVAAYRLLEKDKHAGQAGQSDVGRRRGSRLRKGVAQR